MIKPLLSEKVFQKVKNRGKSFFIKRLSLFGDFFPKYKIHVHAVLLQQNWTSTFGALLILKLEILG